ncbi:hypothetical protein BDA96_04G164700 [Sorghum bicolor]|uniref:Uncharacterized protein n=2 Tax=Sorghum bicolor TaxID=4558 RepID=A0A921R363_SORBI|nr:uncharacterized protein LOC110434467 isoform X3 [Sorghum bicolor]KAG0533114.1 hypothetical protein BDA96_04G164700 [Sorghum bicolor]KXG30269.1 hypothetical protein SORBI_3004G154700 [Sorghum bicolor]|eukprot:XP_021314240.1 uncharacterized protein LOC110434467 isoform X3 [Sorghum bicolor]
MLLRRVSPSPAGPGLQHQPSDQRQGICSKQISPSSCNFIASHQCVVVLGTLHAPTTLQDRLHRPTGDLWGDNVDPCALSVSQLKGAMTNEVFRIT